MTEFEKAHVFCLSLIPGDQDTTGCARLVASLACFRYIAGMPPTRSRDFRRAFTLLEIVLVLALLVMILSVGVPSLRGQLSRKRLQDSFSRFDTLAIEAQKRSVNDHESYVLAWQKDGSIRVYPVAWDAAQRRTREPAAVWVPNGSDERYTLVRADALTDHPSAEWTFWPSGNCEPVTVKYQGSAGTWEARYNALSARGTLLTFLAR